MLHHPFLVALAAVIAVNVIVAIVAIETGIRRGLGWSLGTIRSLRLRAEAYLSARRGTFFSGPGSRVSGINARLSASNSMRRRGRRLMPSSFLGNSSHGCVSEVTRPREMTYREP